MSADQPVILVADPYLRHGSLKNCKLPLIGIQYRIVVGIILKVVIIWNFKKVFIITKCITFAWKLVHTRFVVLFKSIHAGFPNVRFFLERTPVDVRYDLFDRSIQGFQRGISVFLSVRTASPWLTCLHFPVLWRASWYRRRSQRWCPGFWMPCGWPPPRFGHKKSPSA